MFKSEEALRDSFLRYAPEDLWTRTNKNAVIKTTTESQCSDGRADWVWASADRWPKDLSTEAAVLLRQPTCSRILALLCQRRSHREAYLAERSGVADATFRRWMDALVEYELAVEDSGTYRLGRPIGTANFEVCSFEFKLNDWKRALYQAKRYATFSHRVYVVIPDERYSRVENHLDLFATFNIGLILHDDEGYSERVLYSRKRTPRSRSNFIRAFGMLADQGRIPALV